eukprot:gene56018-74789_t
MANGLILRGQGYRTSIGLIGNTLFWMVVALSALTVWMLLGTWRHMRRRAQIQSALVQETNFRRAMENSMLTGMRAMDTEGRVTYVNPAFCAMTGYSEAEQIGRLPPFPYWPSDRLEENARLFQQELQGRSPAGGIEVKVMRKDGSVFDARMYVSPLIDPKGQQTGWMTSMTNITEAKRVRDQLSPKRGKLTLEDLRQAFFDDWGTPYSVCRPPRLNSRGVSTATTAMILMRPAAGHLEACPMPALNRQFTTYTLTPDYT